MIVKEWSPVDEDGEIVELSVMDLLLRAMEEANEEDAQLIESLMVVLDNRENIRRMNNG